MPIQKKSKQQKFAQLEKKSYLCSCFENKRYAKTLRILRNCYMVFSDEHNPIRITKRIRYQSAEYLMKANTVPNWNRPNFFVT